MARRARCAASADLPFQMPQLGSAAAIADRLAQPPRAWRPFEPRMLPPLFGIRTPRRGWNGWIRASHRSCLMVEWLCGLRRRPRRLGPIGERHICSARARHNRPVDIESSPVGEAVGTFRFLIADQRWEWSDEVALMHGYEPGTVVPTTELVLSHKHPEDKPAVAALINNVVQIGQPFSSRHRIVDTSGRIHLVVVVSDQLFDDARQVVGSAGFYIDITDAFESDVQRRVGKATEQIAAHRAVIEQARGILMYVYNVPAPHALKVLRWRARDTGTDLHGLCEEFVKDASSREMTSDLQRREVDHMLFTAHTRVTG